MSWIELPGGRFAMGSDDHWTNHADGESPIREVEVAPFAIASTTVTNLEFAGFAQATGYATTAERQGFSFVFAGLLPESAPNTQAPVGTPWWRMVWGASWRHPEGHGSTLDRRWNHPVVHISHDDATAYADWAGCRLPTEVEWEYAARGGLAGCVFPWGDELCPDDGWRMNVWQGSFPDLNTGDDGYLGTCPADAFPPNGYGLHNCTGNVWEWTADRFDPHGPEVSEAPRALRGGSYLCHESYCNRFRVAARTRNAPSATAGHQGFRVAR